MTGWTPDQSTFNDYENFLSLNLLRAAKVVQKAFSNSNGPELVRDQGSSATGLSLRIPISTQSLVASLELQLVAKWSRFVVRRSCCSILQEHAAQLRLHAKRVKHGHARQCVPCIPWKTKIAECRQCVAQDATDIYLSWRSVPGDY